MRKLNLFFVVVVVPCASFMHTKVVLATEFICATAFRLYYIFLMWSYLCARLNFAAPRFSFVQVYIWLFVHITFCVVHELLQNRLTSFQSLCHNETLSPFKYSTVCVCEHSLRFNDCAECVRVYATQRSGEF